MRRFLPCVDFASSLLAALAVDTAVLSTEVSCVMLVNGTCTSFDVDVFVSFFMEIACSLELLCASARRRDVRNQASGHSRGLLKGMLS